jgi:hypothetical protein
MKGLLFKEGERWAVERLKKGFKLPEAPKEGALRWEIDDVYGVRVVALGSGRTNVFAANFLYAMGVTEDMDMMCGDVYLLPSSSQSNKNKIFTEEGFNEVQAVTLEMLKKHTETEKQAFLVSFHLTAYAPYSAVVTALPSDRKFKESTTLVRPKLWWNTADRYLTVSIQIQTWIRNVLGLSKAAEKVVGAEPELGVQFELKPEENERLRWVLCYLNNRLTEIIVWCSSLACSCCGNPDVKEIRSFTPHGLVCCSADGQTHVAPAATQTEFRRYSGNLVVVATPLHTGKLLRTTARDAPAHLAELAKAITQ